MEKLSNEFINTLICKFKKKENMDKMNNEIIEPLLYFFIKKLYPYIIFICCIFALIIVLLICTLFLIK